MSALLPSNAGRRGRPFDDARKVAEAVIYRYGTGISWRRDLPRSEFEPWQAAWKRTSDCRRKRGPSPGMCLLGRADAAGLIDWRWPSTACLAKGALHARCEG
ncbi:transposase [Prescottella equi]|uniref:transposase n=1 Tax=Rhodococcus hoagii TaxID=43767 RepID=UPI0009BD928A